MQPRFPETSSGSQVAPRLIGLVVGITLLLGSASFAHAAEPQQKVYYFLHDHLGGISAVTDEEGNVVERRDYLPYGTERLLDEADLPAKAGVTDYGFTGKEQDPESELYYYGARYYDPVIGRFISQDPWGGDLTNPQTLNKYSYALNNPIWFIDPTGMYIIKTGEVEKGDTLIDISNQINEYYGTNYNYNDIAKMNNISDPNKIVTGSKIRVGTPDGWQPPMSSEGLDEAYWNSLTSEQKTIMKAHKNFYQSDLPNILDQINSSEFTEPIEATAHNIGTSGNVEVRGKGSKLGQQGVYNTITRQRVDTPENMGTFDIVPPSVDLLGHVRVDVIPWLEGGNSPTDKTTRQDRINALSETPAGRAALVYWSYLRSLKK